MKEPVRTYNERFLEVIQQLNDDQRAAVDQIDGPVMVLAGPGTGKTHMLAARIGRILLETDTQAHNILCLTFTDAGVHAMRRRLLAFIGPEAHRVHIFTFHSFCNKVIQDNLELFGRRELEPISELEKVEVLRQLIDELDSGHPLKRGRHDVYFYEQHLDDLFKRMKAENWTTDYVLDRIDAYVQSLSEREEFIYKQSRGRFKKGDIKEAKVREVSLRMDLLRSAVRLFPRYKELMRRKRRYDYEDMILWVLEAFRSNEWLLRTYQEQYLYFLVDEYQDTNGAQNAVLQELIRYWPVPNVFIVGDDDQSIYEFQGARLRNLVDFYEQYRDSLKLVVLTENYRSAQPILDASSGLIQENERRIVHQLEGIEIDKKLEAKNPAVAALPTKPRIVEYANPLHQEAGMLQQIETLQREGYPLEEVAIIYARHDQAKSLMQLFEKTGMPYHTRRKVNILNLPLIQQLRWLLEYLHAEFERPYSGEHQLFKVLHAPFWKIELEDLAALSMYRASRSLEERPAWRDLLSALPPEESLPLKNRVALQQAKSLLLDLIEAQYSMPLPRLLEAIYSRSGLLAYTMGHEQKYWFVQMLHSFLQFVEEEVSRRPRLRLDQLLESLDQMDANRISLDLQQQVVAEQGVNLLTAHSAKGLEFGKVFLYDCDARFWEPQSRRGNHQFVYPDTLTFSGEEDAMEARRRLFYVAITRAKESLTVTYAAVNKKGKDTQRSQFIDELLMKGGGEEIREEALPAADLMEVQLMQLEEAGKPQVDRLEREKVDELLEDFVLSVSALNLYLRCPLAFYYERVLQVPQMRSPASGYGIAVHAALQWLFLEMHLSKAKKFPGLSAFLKQFEREMKRQEGYFSEREFTQRLETGKAHLEAFYKRSLDSWHKKVFVEKSIRQVEVAGVPLKGVIDKVEFFENDSVHIVDYKTGKPDKSKMREPGKSKPEGGSYWRQLYFYYLLYQQYRPGNIPPSQGVIQYVDPTADGTFERFELDYEARHAEFMLELIQQIYEKIKEHDFYEGCGEKNCRWCAFTRQQMAFDSLASPDMEELDDPD